MPKMLPLHMVELCLLSVFFQLRNSLRIVKKKPLFSFVAIGTSNNKYIKIISDSPTLLILKEKNKSTLQWIIFQKTNETAAGSLKK